MFLKVNTLLLVLIVSILLVIHSSTSSTLENDKLIELEERFDQKMRSYQTKIDSEIQKLKAENSELKTQNAQQDQELVLLKNQILHLEALLPTKRTVNDSNKIDGDANSAPNNGPSTRALSAPPSSCQELFDRNDYVRPMDGIHLLKNQETNKFEATFCIFPIPTVITNPVVEVSIGTVDIKTKTVHFYVQRNSTFSTNNAIIPFKLAQLNEGSAFNLASGIFTTPVSGIFHFDFSAIKDYSATFLDIYFQVNGVTVGRAYTDQGTTGSRDTVSLSASMRLAAGDTVNLWNNGNGVLFDDAGHNTHFSGWLVAEDFM